MDKRDCAIDDKFNNIHKIWQRKNIREIFYRIKKSKMNQINELSIKNIQKEYPKVLKNPESLS